MDAQKRLIIRIGLLTLLLASLVGFMLVLIGEPTPQAHNARTLTQLQQYVTALELVRLEMGTYPITDGLVCVGDYPDDRCWDEGGQGVKEDLNFNDMLDTYVPLLSSGPLVENSENPEEDREGYVYQSLTNGNGYEIHYLLMGKDRKCGFGQDISLNVVRAEEHQNTLCTIKR